MVQPASFFQPELAMITNADKQRAALERRIQQFYHCLNERDFDQCYQMIDPRVRDQRGSVSLAPYQDALLQFIDRFGPLNVLEVSASLHLDETNKLYEGRDFAVGKTICADKDGERRVFSERWVRQGRDWYTRSTGFIVPEAGRVPTTAQNQKAQLPSAGL
jgi:hypothetical protein